MQDLTKIDKPFGLLDEATQKALREYEGELEGFGERGWEALTNHPGWLSYFTYRAKPQPPQPREWWLNVYGSGRSSAHPTKEEADTCSANRLACVRVREVLEDAR